MINFKDLSRLSDSVNKTEFSEKERKDLAKRGLALPDGSFPIRNKQDLRDAVKAIGLSRDYATTKKWIITRARALKALDLLPESWSISDSLINDSNDDAFARMLDAYFKGLGLDVIIKLQPSGSLPKAELYSNGQLSGVVELVKIGGNVSYKSRSRTNDFSLNKALVLLDKQKADDFFDQDGNLTKRGEELDKKGWKDLPSLWKLAEKAFWKSVKKQAKEVGKEALDEGAKVMTNAMGPAGDLANIGASLIGNAVSAANKKYKSELKKQKKKAGIKIDEDDDD